MKELENFYRDSVMRETVKEFLIGQLKEMAVENAFEGKSVVGIQEAKNCIDKSFNTLSEMYDIIKDEVIPNSK
jgi:hypothetical protein